MKAWRIKKAQETALFEIDESMFSQMKMIL